MTSSCIDVPWFCACRFSCAFDVTWLAALKASASVKHVVLDIVGPPSFTGWAQLCLLLSWRSCLSCFGCLCRSRRSCRGITLCTFRLLFPHLLLFCRGWFYSRLRVARRPSLCSGRAGVSFFSEAVAVPMVIILSVFRCRILKVAVSGLIWASS